MERNDQGRYGYRDGRRPDRRYGEDTNDREQGRWESEGGSFQGSAEDNRRWTESDQGNWQGREDYRRPGEDRWGRFPGENNPSRFSSSGENRREGRGREYPSSGTYGSSSYGTGYGARGYQGYQGYQGERPDRDWRGSYDDSSNINRESYPQTRPYQQATGVAGQERYRYEEQVRRGRPPRTYKRSDDRIHDEICEIVARESDLDASQVDVRVENGEVTLTGEVADRRTKRELEDVSERVFGVVDIHNQLHVRKSLLNELGERIFGTTSDDAQARSSTTPTSKTQSNTKM